MKRGKKEEGSKILGNRNWIIVIIIIILLAIVFGFGIFKLTGNVVSDSKHSLGPSSEEQTCMMSCMECTSPGVGCTGNQQKCQTMCNLQKPKVTEETSCMEKCVAFGCDEFDFSCQTRNQDKCEKECNMLGDKPDESEMSAEQLCISNCVEAESPGTRCGASQTGETGNELCQRCAASCVHLYAGPCLNDEKLEAKKKECQTCDNCYGEPVMGPSGEGWDCIVDVKCGNASSQFGDEPGTGPGIGQEGFVANIGNAIGNVVEAIGNFFKGIFGGGETQTPETTASTSSE
mgnify:FL=1